MGPLRVALLGDFRATAGDDLLVAGGAKQRAVLAMLALDAGRVVPESRLIDGIWGDQTPNAVRGSLQVYVAHWRRVFAQAGCEERIERHGSGYLLTMDPLGLDVRRVEALAAHGRTALAEERFPLAAQRFTEALQFWRGETLHDFTEMPFHLWESVAIETMRTELMADRVDAVIGKGGGGELIPELEVLVQHHPYEERFRVQLMHALYRAGRQVDAVRACAAAREVLGEIGLDIGSALRRMEQRVLQQDPELDSPVSPFPPAGPPEVLSTMIGRDRQVDDVVDAVVHGTSRLVTLVGPGGVGKSRLALEVAHRVTGDGWMPVAYTELGDSGDLLTVSSRVNEALGLPESWRERSTSEVARMLGRSPLLVVIDGAEHLLAAVQSVVADLLQHGRLMRVLVTSRSELGIAGETVHQILPLPVHAHDAGPENRDSVRGIPSVAMFLERAERVLTAADVSDAGLRSIAAICRAVDGLPLAIELAAARVTTLGIAGLERRLDSSLDVLAAPGRPGARRHQSLRDVISWSYELLTPAAQDLLAVLAVMPGGFTLEHAEALAGDAIETPVLDTFEELARHSLITRSASGPMPTFRMLDTVRTYGRERLEDRGRSDEVHRRLVAWVGERVEQVGGRMGVGSRQFAPLEAEIENARAAMNWLLERGTADEAGEFCERLYVWWMSIGRAEEIGSWAGTAGRESEVDSRIEGKLALIRGRVEGRRDRFDSSNALLSRSLEVARLRRDDDAAVHAASSLVENLVHQGRLDEARALVETVVLSIAKSRDPEVRCRALHAACWLAGAQGDHENAISLGVSLASEAEEAGLAEFEAKTLADLAWITRSARRPDAAMGWARRAVEVAEQVATGGAVVSALTELAFAHLELGAADPAADAAVRGLTYESGDDLSPSSVLRLSLVLYRAASQSQRTQLQGVAHQLTLLAISSNETVGVWTGDEHIVGDVFRILSAEKPKASQSRSPIEFIGAVRAIVAGLRDASERATPTEGEGAPARTEATP